MPMPCSSSRSRRTRSRHVEQDLNRFNQALDAVEDLRRLVKSPVFSADEQVRAIAAILEKMQIEGLTANFLKLIARNRRLFAAPDMIKAFRALLARHRGQTSAEVTSAGRWKRARCARYRPRSKPRSQGRAARPQS